MFGIEFYVICVIVAAVVIAAVSLPSRRQAVRTYFYRGTLLDAQDDDDPAPTVRFSVRDDGTVSIFRTGLGLSAETGECNLALKVSGFDVTIEERLIAPRDGSAGIASSAITLINCLGPERFHFLYRNEDKGLSAAFTLNLRPGNTIVRQLTL